MTLFANNRMKHLTVICCNKHTLQIVNFNFLLWKIKIHLTGLFFVSRNSFADEKQQNKLHPCGYFNYTLLLGRKSTARKTGRWIKRNAINLHNQQICGRINVKIALRIQAKIAHFCLPRSRIWQCAKRAHRMS